MLIIVKWFSLSIHNLLTMHGHRNLKNANYILYGLFNCGVCVDIF